MPTITLRTADAASALSAERWWELASLRRLLGVEKGTILGHDAGPDPAAPVYAFLAADVSHVYAPGLRTVRRFFVVLPNRGILSMDLVSGPAAVSWRLEGEPGPKFSLRSIPPKPGAAREGDTVFFHMLLFPSVAAEPILSVDLAGARAGDLAVLFHTGTGMANSSLFFDVAGKGNLLFLIAGLTPGFWEVWRDGFLEDNARQVLPQKGTLFYEGEAGGYFLRQR